MLLCLNSTEPVARGEQTPPQDGDSVPATAAASAEAPAAADQPAEAGNTATVSPLQALVQDIMQQQKQRAQVGANPLSVIGPPKVLVSLCHPLNPISLSELTQGTATSGNVGLPCGHASCWGRLQQRLSLANLIARRPCKRFAGRVTCLWQIGFLMGVSPRRRARWRSCRRA